MKIIKNIACFCFIIILCSFFLLVGCGAKEIYRDDNVVASLENSVDDRIDLSVDLRLSSTTLSGIALQTLETFPNSKDLDVSLSDGTFYGFDGLAAEGAKGVNWKVYSSIDEIEKDLNMDLISSTEIKYPDKGNHFLLMYNPDAYNISIHEASTTTDDYDISNISLMISFDGKTNYTSRSVIDVSDSIQHQELKTNNGKRVDVFIDQTKEKAGIYLLTSGCVYNWELNHIQSLDDVKSFVNSLE